VFVLPKRPKEKTGSEEPAVVKFSLNNFIFEGKCVYPISVGVSGFVKSFVKKANH